jgi:hypothetical protein
MTQTSSSLVSDLEFAHDSYLRPNGHGGYIIRQSDLSSWAYCPLRKFYEDRARADRDAPQPATLSATEYGTVMHYVLMNLELAYHEGAENALEQAIASFEHYWQPENIGAVASPITEWLPRQTYGGLRDRGRAAIKAYYDLLKGDDSRLLALEYQFAIPLPINGRLHTLTGTVDRLSIRRQSGKPYLSLDDFKTGKQVTFLRHNQQGHAYGYASTHPAFWQGWEDSGLQTTESFVGEQLGKLSEYFESHGYRLHDGSLNTQHPVASRRFRWINIKDVKYVDGGWRNERDYARLLLGIDGYIRAAEAGAYPPNLKGEPCAFCSFRKSCGGVGLPAEGAGAP